MDSRAAIALRLGEGAQSEILRSVAKLPVLVARNGTSDHQTATSFYISEEGLPGVLVQGLRRRKNDKLWRTQFGNLVFGNEVRRDVQGVGEGTNCLLLRFELQVAENRELRSLRGDDRNGGLLRIF